VKKNEADCSGGDYNKDQIKVLVEVELKPTEDESRVREAVINLTGSDDFRRISKGKRTYLIQEGDDRLLSRLRSLLRRERILDAARKYLLRGTEYGTTINFCLNKQAAFAGHASFCAREGESPMGPICFSVVTNDPNRLIDWLATKTIGGIPVDEKCQLGYPRSAFSEEPSSEGT